MSYRKLFLVSLFAGALNSQSAFAESVSQTDAESVCYSAGMTHLPRASHYEAFFGKSGDGPTYISSNGVFSFNAPFAYAPSKVVNALASYQHELTAEEGKLFRIRFTGSIANMRHGTENFRLLLGYKIDGTDHWTEMTWHESPTTTYTAYTVDFEVPSVEGDSLPIWFEGRYTENGQEKRVYDSNYNRNFLVTIVEDTHKSLCFDNGWREALLGGDIAAGDSVEIVYDVGRLMDRMMGTTYASWPAWSAYMHYKVTNADGSPAAAGKLPLFASAFDPENGSGSTVRPSYKPLLKIPASAQGGRLAVWFEGPNRGPTVWDSQFQQNYVVEIR